MTITRRELRGSALTGAAIATGGLFSGLTIPRIGAAAGTGGYGGLVADPAGIIDLPRGFRYQILQRGGSNTPDEVATTYDDGQKVAGDADGAASFAIGGGKTVIVTNHELSGPGELAERVPHTFHGRPIPTYDPAETGGTSNIVLDPRNRVISIYPSLAGTKNNCAGGLTPWGTWLTCEETTANIGGVQHGYIFEVDPTGRQTVAEPYRAMGRMAHEAVAIDPVTSVAYETEDADRGLVYRFLPNDTSQTYGSLGNGGTLQAMKVDGLYRLGEVRTVGTTLDVSWVDVPGGNADIPALNGAWEDAQVTRSRKLEGIWWSAFDDRVYIVSSGERNSNAPAPITGTSIEHGGQVWAFDPAAQTIQLVAHIPVGHEQFDGPDNICIAPWGTAFLCEDGSGDQYLVGVDPATGDLWPFAFNRTGDNEFAGANFSPDGKTMFVNVQNPSMTVAITGPWSSVQRVS